MHLLELQLAGAVPGHVLADRQPPDDLVVATDDGTDPRPELPPATRAGVVEVRRLAVQRRPVWTLQQVNDVVGEGLAQQPTGHRVGVVPVGPHGLAKHHQQAEVMVEHQDGGVRQVRGQLREPEFAGHQQLPLLGDVADLQQEESPVEQVHRIAPHAGHQLVADVADEFGLPLLLVHSTVEGGGFPGIARRPIAGAEFAQQPADQRVGGEHQVRRRIGEMITRGRCRPVASVRSTVRSRFPVPLGGRSP